MGEFGDGGVVERNLDGSPGMGSKGPLGIGASDVLRDDVGSAVSRARSPLLRDLAETKLAGQRARRGWVDRAELVERLNSEACSKTLTLVIAPAGWGKTTLLAQWQLRYGESTPLAWVSLDSRDNDASLFWSYVLEAVRRVGRRQGEESGEPFHFFEDTVDAVPSVVNRLHAESLPVILVLDNYHVVTNDRIHRAVAYMIEHLPDQAHVVISSRSEPPFPLGRLRCNGALGGLGLMDLRLTTSETARVVGEVGAALDEADVLRLWDLTEGWPAGVQLAVSSMRGQGDVANVVDRLVADDRPLADYIVQEIGADLPEELWSFLCATSLLDRMCGPLCDAILDTSGSELLLEKMERQQLFVVALDDGRFWYRYHYLFGKLLRRELRRAVSPPAISQLHRRAAQWLLREGYLVEGVKQGLAAGDVDCMVELIGQRYIDCITQSKFDVVLGWLEQLPRDVVRRSAAACLARAETLLFSGQVELVEPWLGAAEEALSPRGLLSGHFASVEVAAAHIRSTKAYFRGDLSEASRWANEAAAHHQRKASTCREAFLASYIRGAIAYRDGDLSAAYVAFENDIAWAEVADRPQLGIAALSLASLVELDREEVAHARALLERALERHSRHNFTQPWVAALMKLAEGRLLRHGEDLSAARTTLSAGLELARRGPDRLCQVDLLRSLSATERRLGQRERATAYVKEADAILDSCPSPGSVLSSWRLRWNAEGTPGSSVHLTRRQTDVLRLVARGMPNAEVAALLSLSERTVHAHLRAIYKKLGVSSRTAAALSAIKDGLTD